MINPRTPKGPMKVRVFQHAAPAINCQPKQLMQTVKKQDKSEPRPHRRSRPATTSVEVLCQVSQSHIASAHRLRHVGGLEVQSLHPSMFLFQNWNSY